MSWQTSDGAGSAEQLTDAGPDVQVPHAVSPDGGRVVLRVGVNPPYDLAILLRTVTGWSLWFALDSTECRVVARWALAGV